MGIPAETFATDALFQPLKLGRIEVANRMAMAPLTRSRANDALEPTDMVVEYYRQRAGVGLIIAEATQISATAQGYTNTPGIHTPAQIAAWKQVTDAVHAKGGKIFLQLWHTGRMSHNAFQPNQQAPVAPSMPCHSAHTLPAASIAPARRSAVVCGMRDSRPHTNGRPASPGAEPTANAAITAAPSSGPAASAATASAP